MAEAAAWSAETLLLLGRDEAAHFLAPADAKISWILRNADNGTATSQPFGPPFLLATERAFARIRNMTVDHMPDTGCRRVRH